MKIYCSKCKDYIERFDEAGDFSICGSDSNYKVDITNETYSTPPYKFKTRINTPRIKNKDNNCKDFKLKRWWNL